MAFKRACRVGEAVSVPALCDDAFEANAAALMQREAEAAGMTAEESAVFGVRRSKELRNQVLRYADTFDESILEVPLDGVSRVLIQGLSGAQFAEAESAGAAAAARAKAAREHLDAYLEAELLRRGLVAVDGFEDAPVGGLYPVEVLMGPRGIGEAWARFREEMAHRIRTWSHLGKPESSSSAP